MACSRDRLGERSRSRRTARFSRYPGGVVFLDSMEGGLSDRYTDTTGETTITAAMELASRITCGALRKSWDCSTEGTSMVTGKKTRGPAVGPSGPRGAAGQTGPRGPVGERGHRGPAGTAALSAGRAPALAFIAFEEQIDGLKHELDVQVRRMAQVQEQLDQLRAIVRRIAAPTKLET